MMVRPLPVSGSVSLCLRGERSLDTVVPRALGSVGLGDGGGHMCLSMDMENGLICMGHRALCPVDRVLSDCKFHGTRKVVNYTVPR